MAKGRGTRTPWTVAPMLVLALVLALGVAACGSDGDSSTSGSDATASNGERYKIYSVIHGNASDPFWAVYLKGVKDAADEFDVDLESLQTQQASIPEHINLFNSAIAAKPDGIIAAFPDPDAAEASMKRAVDQEIPVIAVNAADYYEPPDKRLPYLFYIGGDEELGGREMAERVLEDFTPKHAACVNHEAGQVTQALRCKGFKEVLEPEGTNVDDVVVDGTNPTKMETQLRGYLDSNSDVDLLFTIGPPPTSVALQVLKDQGLEDRVTLTSYDLTPEQIKAIEDGRLLGTIEQQQYLQGYLGIHEMVLFLNHEFSLGGDILTGPNLIDEANADAIAAEVEDGYH